MDAGGPRFEGEASMLARDPLVKAGAQALEKSINTSFPNEVPPTGGPTRMSKSSTEEVDSRVEKFYSDVEFAYDLSKQPI